MVLKYHTATFIFIITLQTAFAVKRSTPASVKICVALSECPPLKRLQHSAKNLPGFSENQVDKLISDNKCGVDGDEIKVLCDFKEEFEDGEEEEKQQKLKNFGPSSIISRVWQEVARM